ncbi:hypothetical protein COU54_02220 [Candidatus Pacearchaeota archaeon CG10_big_fil_rev_8_21_14_0_10_31_24]|nr:MAG: hypothetical protein COU54_02220 [Candidatus Pacearchaeota archaeon CG10_big_fil_rev_8_21_14_0_10_31_24]
MKKTISKTEAKSKIDNFFQKDKFTSEEVKKIKRLAMSHRIKLSEKRKFFCQKCLSQLNGKIRITKTHKTIECANCKFKNKHKLQ